MGETCDLELARILGHIHGTAYGKEHPPPLLPNGVPPSAFVVEPPSTSAPPHSKLPRHTKKASEGTAQKTQATGDTAGDSLASSTSTTSRFPALVEAPATQQDLVANSAPALAKDEQEK